MHTHRIIGLLVAVALAVVAILTAQDVIATSHVASESLDTLRMQRSSIADAARWTAMGEYYQKRAEAENLARSRRADSARWTAMAEYYQKRAEAEAQNLARAQGADAARWTAMAKYYARVAATTP